MPKVTYKNIEFDSNEEMYFYWWCEELMNHGYIETVVTHPRPVQLSLPVEVTHIKPMKKVADKVLTHKLLNGHQYTFDALIQFTKKGYDMFCIDLLKEGPYSKSDFSKLVSRDAVCSVEVKPLFDQNNMTRLAIINQKWTYETTGRFVNIVIPEKLFAKTFTPKRYLTNNILKTKRKIKFKTRSLEEFVKINTTEQLSLI